MWAQKQKGFTIVELLIVIVVIAILAAITVVAFNGIQDRARLSKMKADLTMLRKAVDMARQNNSSNLNGVTGSNASGANCWNKPTGTDLATLPATDTCIVAYNNALSTISNASGSNVRNLRDPWGRPYLIDENEGEGAGNCTRDTLAVYRLPFVTGFGVHTDTSANNVTNAGFTGCAP